MDKNADFIEKKKTKQQILEEFLNNFEGAKGNKDGIITREEFFDYYTDISMSIPNDDYFIGVIESAWMIAECEDAASYETKLKSLTAEMLEKLKNVAFPLDEKMLQKLFKEINKSKSGTITIDELAAMMTRLGISVERKFLTGLFKKFDMNLSGTIEYDEFCAFVLSKPLLK